MLAWILSGALAPTSVAPSAPQTQPEAQAGPAPSPAPSIRQLPRAYLALSPGGSEVVLGFVPMWTGFVELGAMRHRKHLVTTVGGRLAFSAGPYTWFDSPDIMGGERVKQNDRTFTFRPGFIARMGAGKRRVFGFGLVGVHIALSSVSGDYEAPDGENGFGVGLSVGGGLTVLLTKNYSLGFELPFVTDFTSFRNENGLYPTASVMPTLVMSWGLRDSSAQP